MSAKDKLLALKSTYLDNESVSNREQLGFAGGIFGNAMGQDSVDTFSDKFNRNFMGISNAMLTVKGNISTVLGFFIPPIAGSLYDLPTRAGKKSNIRKAMLITPIPFGIFSMLLFIVPTKSAMWNFVWALFFHTLFTIVDTFYDIALNALAFKMVSEPADRKKFFTFESISSTLGSMAPGGIIPIIVGMTDDAHKQQWLYFFIALGFCIIGIIAMYAPYFTIAERAPILAAEAKKEDEKIRWDKNMISAIIHNRPFMVLQLANMFDCIRQITYKLLPYLYDDTFGDYKMKAVIDAISGSLSYVGLLAVPFLGKKFSARAILSGGYFYTAFFYGIMSVFNFKTVKSGSEKQFDIDFMRKFRYPICLCIGFGGIPNAAQGASRKIIVEVGIEGSRMDEGSGSQGSDSKGNDNQGNELSNSNGLKTSIEDAGRENSLNSKKSQDMGQESGDAEGAQKSLKSGEESQSAVNRIRVHICGEVATPGVYEIDEGSRVIDAVELAGGFTDKDIIRAGEEEAYVELMFS